MTWQRASHEGGIVWRGRAGVLAQSSQSLFLQSHSRPLRGPTLMTSSNPKYPPEALSPNTSIMHLGLSFQHVHFWEHQTIADPVTARHDQQTQGLGVD